MPEFGPAVLNATRSLFDLMCEEVVRHLSEANLGSGLLRASLNEIKDTSTITSRAIVGTIEAIVINTDLQHTWSIR